MNAKYILYKSVYDIIKKEIVFISRIKVKGNHGANVIVRSTAIEKILTTENGKNLAAKIKVISKCIMKRSGEMTDAWQIGEIENLRDLEIFKRRREE